MATAVESCVAQLERALFATSGRVSVDQVLEAVVDGALVGFGLKAATPPGTELETDAAPIRHQLLRGIREAPPFTDVLGPLYMSMRSTGKARALGQWFTPQPVAAFMNAILLDGCSEVEPCDTRLRSMCDPCCGSGVQLLNAAAAIYRAGGREAVLRWSFTGIDLDNLCAKITAFAILANAALHGIPVGELLVYRGNSLAAPDQWRVIVHATAPQVPAAAVVPALAASRTRAIRNASLMLHEQLRLF